MERRADELLDRAGIDLGVAGRGQNEARVRDGGRVAFDAQLALLAPEQARERAERAALALAAAPALAVEAARAGAEAEAAAVFFVQRADRLFRRAERGGVLRALFFRRRGQIREQAEREGAARARAAAGKVQLFEPPRGLRGALRSREQRGDHADGLSLRRDAAAQIHTRHPAGADKAGEEQIGQLGRRLRDRQKQQRRRPKAPAEADEQRESRRERESQGEIVFSAGRAFFVKEKKAHVPPFAAGAFHQLPRQRRRVLSRSLGHALEPPEIVPLRQRVHARIFPRRIEREDQPRYIHLLAERVEIHLRQLPQRGEERGEDRRAALVSAGVAVRTLHRPADLRERGDHGAARKGAQAFKLALLQGTDALKAVEKVFQPLLRQFSPARTQQRAAEREAEALPPRGAQRAAALQFGRGTLRLASGEIIVVEYPFLRAGERLSPRLLRAQRAVAAAQRPHLLAQAAPLGARGACAVDGKQPRRRDRVGIELARVDVQSGRNDVHSSPSEKKKLDNG